ncbi:hypothetical protein [Nitrosopumilus ureiphilus]|uniref:Uncharacterized protein n=1 Tax=Nitrosopumilus ureiphilus TaxID=1470067 RepID=A0A7D5R7L4_9ARCH|nr:hypothetical protein [Nitrosopumilus ureiphilus]QLH07657.1 hypothetical protein C5F50_11690 [Nitrosopumilus ureiphilus]
MSTDDSPSICNVWKGNTSKIINKLELQIPSHFQIYSDMYKEYLRSIDDIFGTCVLSEKEFFDKLNIDPNFMKNLGMYSNFLSGIWINQIENYDNYLKWYSQMRISGLKSYEEFIHTMMDSYSKTLSNLSKNMKK